MNGSDPPSSSTCFLMRAAASEAIRAPTSDEPVSVTAAMRSSSISRSVSAPEIRTVRSRPSGKPASRSTCSQASADCGTFDACFSTIPLPAISVGAPARKTCQNGKFHGMIARIVPSGS